MATPPVQDGQGGGLSAGRPDRVHRALTYELTASALVSPLAANSIGHRYVRLNASRQDLQGRGRLGSPAATEDLLPQCLPEAPFSPPCLFFPLL